MSKNGSNIRFIFTGGGNAILWCDMTNPFVIVLIRQEVVFIIAGIIFVVEIGTTFVQETLGINRLFRRILYRAPLHHHFQHQGMAESKIVARFWIISAIMAAVAMITIKFR
jgi:phospho-N-acetylmuramoyl-pentapeptide-transferase